MATYNNKHWLLSHVRNSFISTDDTGLCEAIMLSEDLPSQYAIAQKANALRQAQQQPPPQASPPTPPPPPLVTTTPGGTAVSASAPPIAADYICYPGLDQSDEEDTYPEAQSYDIQMDHGGFIHRSNTAQKLDKMKLASKRAAKIKNVKCLDPMPHTAAVIDTSAADLNSLFVRKPVATAADRLAAHPPSTRLADQLTKHPRLPQNIYQQYARFDGSGQRSNLTKIIRIFLTMLPAAQRNYPMVMCVLETARIQEFIGLICYRASIEYPGIVLQTVRNYSLRITEEDGEVDPDFPPLDLQEPCAKFCFSHLSLVERRASELRQDARTMSLSSEVEALQETLLEENAMATAQQTEAHRRMLGHTTKMEAPIYRSYQLQISRKGFFRTDIQLGISAEKLEIDPVQQQNSRFWSHQKAISHSMDAVVWCEITDEPSPARALVKIVYCPRTGQAGDGASSRRMTTVGDGSSTMVARETGSGGLNNGVTTLPSNAYRSYKFVTDALTAQEIVDKVRNILEVRSSPARREYMQRFAGHSGDAAGATTTTLEKRRKPFKKLFN